MSTDRWDLGPGFNKPLLRFRQIATEAFDRVHREDRRLVLVIRVKMCAVTRIAARSLTLSMRIMKTRESRESRRNGVVLACRGADWVIL